MRKTQPHRPSLLLFLQCFLAWGGVRSRSFHHSVPLLFSKAQGYSPVPSKQAGSPGAACGPAPLKVHFASDPEPDKQSAGPDLIQITKTTTAAGPPFAQYMQLELGTLEGISIHDITPTIREAIKAEGVVEGVVHVVSRHTTTGVMINEYESRLIDDIRQFLLKVAPPTYPYLHNDIHLRPTTEEDKRRLGPSWDIEEWRKQEPKNAHSHLLSILLGNTLAIPVTDGELAIGRWQSVMLVELDGPRTRSVGVQLVAYQKK